VRSATMGFCLLIMAVGSVYLNIVTEDWYIDSRIEKFHLDHKGEK